MRAYSRRGIRVQVALTMPGGRLSSRCLTTRALQMPKLKHSEMRVLDDAFSMHSGYVLDFSDRAMREFFEDEFGIEIYQERYAFNGTSKAKHLHAFVTVEDAHMVTRVLRALWAHRTNMQRYDVDAEKNKTIEVRFNELVAKARKLHRRRMRSTCSSAIRRSRN